MTLNSVYTKNLTRSRVTALQRQLDKAREAMKRQQLAARQTRLNQARAALNK